MKRIFAGAASHPVAELTEEQRLLLGRHGPVRRWILRSPLQVNCILAAANLLLVVVSTVTGIYAEQVFMGESQRTFGPLAWALIIFNIVFSCLVVVRNRAPLVFLLLSIAVEFAFLAVTHSTNHSATGYTAWIFLYTIAAERSGRKTVVGFLALSLFSLSYIAIDLMAGFRLGFETVTTTETPYGNGSVNEVLLISGVGYGFILMLHLVIVMAGRAVRKSRLFDREMIQRFSQTQKLAATEERARIAREMHDVVAHSLTVMIALSDGARIVGRANQDRADEVLQELSSTGRSALADMRRMLGVLRDSSEENAPLTPTAGGDNAEENLAELVSSFESTGLPVTFVHEGQSIPADNNLRLTIYRIVQESLTNALRYGKGVRSVRVKVQVELPDVRITVVNDGSTALEQNRTGGFSLGAGKGISGMKERAALYRGSVEAGPNDVGGWTVRAHLRWEPQA